MADSKGTYSGYREEARKSTPVLIDKLPPEVQEAVRRQLAYSSTSGEGVLLNPDGTRFSFDAKNPSELMPHPRLSSKDVVESSRAADQKVLRDAGLTERTVLLSPQSREYRSRWDVSPGDNRAAATVAADGSVTRSAHRGSMGGVLPYSHARSHGGPAVSTSDHGPFVDSEGKTMGAIRVSREGVKMPPRMKAQPAAGQLASALDGALSKTNMKAGTLIDVGQALYPFLTDEIDTDFTIKLIPPQHRKPDETGKVREAIAILDGEPIRLYEGEPWNVPGFESVGVELADYFRSRSPQSRGQDTLGAEIDPADKGKAGLEVRESEKQAQGKKMYDGYRDLVTEKPRPGRAPTFEEEYQVGKASKEPGKK